MLSCPCVTIVSVNLLETKSSQKWLYFLDMGWMAWIMVGLTIFFHNMYILALSKATSKAIFFKKKQGSSFLHCEEGGYIKYWMRKSKAWYGQVANSQANTNIYNRKCPIWRPIRLLVSQAFLAKVQNQKKNIATNRKRKELLFLFSLHFLGAFFL